MPEGYSEGSEQRGETSSLLFAVEEKISASERLLMVVAAGQGDVSGDEWSQLDAHARRLILLHTAKSMSLVLGRAKIVLKGLEVNESLQLDNQLKEREAVIESLGNRLFQEAEKYT